MDRPRRTRRPDKRHMAKKLPEVHGGYYFSVKIYKEMNIEKKLADNIFWNYFLISHQRYKCFVQFMYIFLTDNDVRIFWRNHFSVFLIRWKEVIPKTKLYLFGIDKFIKQLKKEGKLNFIVTGKKYSERYGYWWSWGAKLCSCVIEDSLQMFFIDKVHTRKKLKINNHCSLLMYIEFIKVKIEFRVLFKSYINIYK